MRNRREFAELRQRLSGLKVGDAVVVPLPDQAYPRRERYHRVAQAMHALYGAGEYRIQSCPGGVMVWRTPGRKAAALAAREARIAEMEARRAVSCVHLSHQHSLQDQ